MTTSPYRCHRWSMRTSARLTSPLPSKRGAGAGPVLDATGRCPTSAAATWLQPLEVDSGAPLVAKLVAAGLAVWGCAIASGFYRLMTDTTRQRQCQMPASTEPKTLAMTAAGALLAARP